MIKNNTKVTNEIHKICFISSNSYKIGQNYDFIGIKLLRAPCTPVNTTLIKINY